ncbi:MAG TPA: hypothetical protein VMY38_04065 [Gemmatimonadaceae bacterium]|nr:hypothetical protein [Gemmatimonadaceae bacterium]
MMRQLSKTNLASFGLPERLRCSLGIAKAAEGASSIEEAARAICEFFFDELVDPAGNPACALVRLYVTQPFARLDGDLQDFARRAAGDHAVRADTRCLTLLGTVGLEPEWNSRTTSRGHKAIPLLSAEVVEKAPMISQLIKAFGLQVSDVVGDSTVVRDLGGKTYGVFFVPDAANSPYIPAQDEFVGPYSIRSVIGCGGSVASGEMFALVLFTRVHMKPESAERFRALALDAKAALRGFLAGQVFDAPDGSRRG